MRIALLTDIHGNREALEACLTDTRRRGADRLVFLGDIVGYGADPEWAVDTVAAEVERGALALRGNHDDAIARPSRMNATAIAAIDWTRPRLGAAQRAFLASLPLTIEEDERLYVHASADAPQRWNYVIERDDAAQSFAATTLRLTFCGHVHVPALFGLAVTGKLIAFEPAPGTPIPLLRQRRWLGVIGAVGQPRDGVPAANYALYDDESCELTYLRVPYDTVTAARKVIAAGLPIQLAQRLELGY
jgi:diadenosine tetraphosphatase ApaH/serine/threonine PP2A family protein phosphatase